MGNMILVTKKMNALAFIFNFSKGWQPYLSIILFTLLAQHLQ